MNFHPIEDSSATAEIVVPKLINWYKPKSVLDLGCNTGWWLYWFIQHGVTEVLGVDGDNMSKELKIPKGNFICADLSRYFNVHTNFDLVICAEVAEHIPEKHSDVLVANAIRHSDTIFWSAANVSQGGYHHVNEQPPEYWIQKFERQGYLGVPLSSILPELPHDYYRKNAIQFIRHE